MQKVGPLTEDPKNLIIYGYPKIGKTSIVATLENNLIIDLEDGSDYISALKIKAKNINEILDICKEIKKMGCPYKYITIDTITALEEMVKPLALKMYQKTPAATSKEGKLFTGDILTAPMGIGYTYVKDAMKQVIGWVQQVCKNVIIIGHIKDGGLDDSGNTKLKDLDLAGKSKRAFAALSDAIGCVLRDDNSNLCIDFSISNASFGGARPTHLTNKCIVVAERLEDGTFKSHWDRIYPSEPFSGEDAVITPKINVADLEDSEEESTTETMQQEQIPEEDESASVTDFGKL